MLCVNELGEFRPVTADDFKNDPGRTYKVHEHREPNWKRKERQMIHDAANYWRSSGGGYDVLERLLWTQVNRHSVHG